MTELRKKVNEALEFIRTKTALKPEIGIILGTGLGGLVSYVDIALEIDYKDIPNFPTCTVESHSGKLIFGKLSGKDVVIMEGRFHYYEGYTMQQITFPIRVMSSRVGLGVNTLFISSAVGGMNRELRRGDLVAISDHINLLGDNPLIGENDDEMGPRFPDMSEAYSRELINLAFKVANEENLELKKGVLVAVAGPNLETPAEYIFLHKIGADIVGMSTVPENIVANHMGMKVFGLSVVTDECFPENLKPVNLAEIIETANKAEPKMALLIKKMIEKL